MAAERQSLIDKLMILPGDDNLVIGQRLEALQNTVTTIEGETTQLAQADEQYRLMIDQASAEHAERSSAIKTRIERSITEGYNPLAEMARKAIAASVGANRMAPELAIAGVLLTDQLNSIRMTTSEVDEQVERFRQLQPGTPIIVCNNEGQIAAEHVSLSGKLEAAPVVDFDQVEGQIKIYLTTDGGQKGSIDIHRLPTMAIGRDEVRSVVFNWWAKVQKNLPEVASYDFRMLINQLSTLSPLRSELSALEPFRARVKEHALTKLKRALDHPASTYEMPDAAEAWGKMHDFDDEAFIDGLVMMVGHSDFKAWHEAEMMVALTLKPNFYNLSKAAQFRVRRQAFNKLAHYRQRQARPQSQAELTSLATSVTAANTEAV